jgi:putative heme transporter
MERGHLKRGYALIVLFVSLLCLTTLVLFLTIPPVAEQLARLARDAPTHRETLIAMLSRYDMTAPLARAWENVEVSETFTRMESYLLGYAPRALLGLGYLVTTLALTFYLLADGKRSRGTLYAVVPRAHHMRLARVLHNLETIVGGYMRGQLITSAAIGTFTFLLLTACRVPNALSLALFAAMVDIIPFVGAVLAIAPAVVAALAVGIPTAIVVLIALLIYQEVESRILIPKVYGKVLQLSPSVVVLALLAGGVLLGILGAMLALPIAAGLQMMLAESGVEMPGDDSDDSAGVERDAQTDATYERMSAGSTAPEAGQIARQLAQDVRGEDAVDAATALAAMESRRT